MNAHASAFQFSIKARTTRRVRLGDILQYEQPTKYLVGSTDYSDEHPTPVLTAGKSFILGYTNETHGIYTGPFPVIIFDDFTTSLHLVDFPFKVKSSAMKILRPCDDNISLSLVVELIRNIGFQPGDHKRHWISEFQDFEIDLPVGEYHDFAAQSIASADAKIDALKGKKAALENYKRGLMQKLFSREIRFTKEDGETFPMWKEVRLGDIFHERAEKGPDGGELLSVTMTMGVVRAADVGRADGASADLSSYKHVLPGDIAYNSMRMWQGASGLSKHSGIVSPAYTVVTPEDDQCGVFWSYYLKLPELVFQFRRHSQGLTSDTWNLKFPAFSRIQVVVPDIAEQKLIGSALMGIDRKIEKLDAHIESMGAFKKGLLKKLFV